MRAEIHPTYDARPCPLLVRQRVHDASDEARDHVEVCSERHLFYTGKQKLMDSGGRVERFRQRQARARPPRRLRQPPKPRGPRDVVGRRLMATIGGQAVLEGVMMRGPSSWAVAVRRPDGRISEIEHDVESVALRRRWLRLPVIRGIVALGESLAIGMRALSVSARFSVTDEGEEDASEELGRFALIGSFVFAIGFSLLLFKVSPALLTNWINPGSTWVFVLIEGGSAFPCSSPTSP